MTWPAFALADTAGWHLDRPLWLLAALIPLALLLSSLRRRTSVPMALGTARFLDDEQSAAASASGRRILPSVLFAVLAAFFAVVALAGPRSVVADADERRFEVVVDRSPSMYLAATSNDARVRVGGSPTTRSEANPNGATRNRATEIGATRAPSRRIDLALDLLESELSRSSTERTRILWCDPTGPHQSVRTHEGWLEDGPPESWLREPEVQRDEVSFLRHGGPAVIWLTDSIPAETAAVAAASGWVASGGGAVPGPVAATSAGIIEWNGGDPYAPESSEFRAYSEDGGPRRPTIALAGTIAAPVQSLVLAWAGQVGATLAVSELEPDRPHNLVVEGPKSDSELETVRLAGLHWSAETIGRRGAAPFTPGVGRLELSFARFTPEGQPDDLSAFGAELLDALEASLKAPAGVKDLAERLDAGSPEFHAPMSATEDRPDSPMARQRAADDLARIIGGALVLIAGVLGLLAALSFTKGR